MTPWINSDRICHSTSRGIDIPVSSRSENAKLTRNALILVLRPRCVKKATRTDTFPKNPTMQIETPRTEKKLSRAGSMVEEGVKVLFILSRLDVFWLTEGIASSNAN